jgi:hypothetical protein
LGGNARGQRLHIGKFATQRAVSSHKISVTKLAHGSSTVLLAARPQVAARKTAEHRRPTGVSAFTLECVKNFFDLVAHARAAPDAKAVTAKQVSQQAAPCGKRACAARFLIMVVLYMTPKNRKAGYAGVTKPTAIIA